MPFGKHKGQPLAEISAGYLQWVLTTNPRGWLEQAVKDELARR
jgi:uncharacterized protein (DUF3820 family)